MLPNYFLYRSVNILLEEERYCSRLSGLLVPIGCFVCFLDLYWALRDDRARVHVFSMGVRPSKANWVHGQRVQAKLHWSIWEGKRDTG